MYKKDKLLNKKDKFIMYGMTLIYLIIALFNLGNMYAPKTGWIPNKVNESFVVEFGEKVSLERITLFEGRGIGWDVWGVLNVEYNDNGKFKPLTKLTKNSVFVWTAQNVNVSTDKLRFTASMYQNGNVKSFKAEYLEIGIFEKGKRKPVTDLKIVDKKPAFLPAEKLFDESKKVAYRPTYLNGAYFDEIYHARTGYETLHGIGIYETTHPPLGKNIIALGILIFGMNPFGWRIMGTLFGVAMIPLMYCFGKKMFKSTFYAFCTAFLMMFDFMHFTQTRISTIDVYVTFFVILMFYFMYDYYVNNSYELGYPKSLKPLLLSGIFFGLGAASKWIALYGAVGLAVLFFSSRLREYKTYKLLMRRSRKNRRKIHWLKDFVDMHLVRTSLWCIVFFVIIPISLYSLSYLPIMNFHDSRGFWEEIWNWQKHMYNYHSHLNATHPYASTWWQWPIMSKPMWYYGGSYLPAGKGSSIVSFGNPAIWWVGIYAFFASIIIKISKRDLSISVPIIALLSQYLPWAISPRKLTFIYHFFSCVPFIILCIVYVIKNLVASNPKRIKFVYAYLGVVAALFFIFYPVLSGLEVPRSYLDWLKWVKSWGW